MTSSYRLVAGGFRRALCVGLVLASTALPTLAFDPQSQSQSRPRVGTSSSLSPSAILIDRDDRLSPSDYAAFHHLPATVVAARYGATGVVRCGGAVGTGQLVGSSGVLVTASHVLFEPGGQSRGGTGSCTFDIVVGGRHQVVAILTQQVICGATEPYANPAVRDWAVAPLERSIAGVRPYPLAGAIAVPSTIVLAAAARSGGVESHSLEMCTARKVTGSSPSGVREIAIDCDAEGGTSGAALLTENGAFAGVYVGFRSAHPGTPGPFSMTHYNFGVTAEGALRKAINETAARTQPLSASR
jgi:hypothetical protein